ncbi:hypothetical protein WMY93_033940 [Mugilogobius chulae]|uniref:MHC class I antigen n=1 Tax=Mugilogobius chulae TaxID=88201 RepID=A0AAW0MM74_9GOBI
MEYGRIRVRTGTGTGTETETETEERTEDWSGSAGRHLHLRVVNGVRTEPGGWLTEYGRNQGEDWD